MGYDVFISHSSANIAVADAMTKRLERGGVDCFFWLVMYDQELGEVLPLLRRLVTAK